MLAAAAWGAIASASLLIGAFLAIRLRPSNHATGLCMGFGAGALISAIAYELIPDSMMGQGGGMAIAFLLGAITFFGSDWLIDHRGGKERKSITGGTGSGSGTAIFLGTLIDGVPESLILGMGLALGGSISMAFLAAVFVSNVPEGVAGTICLEAEGRSQRDILWMWASLVIASAIAAALGYGIVRLIPTADGRFAQAFAAGAMLTMLADVMMPEAFEHGGKEVGLLTVLGFLIAAVLSFVE